MSQPTATDIFNTARSLVGDPAGQVATNAALTPFWNGIVYPELFQAMAKVQTPQVEREFYYTVPAFTTLLDPQSIGITDMGNPTLMEERQPGTSLPAITSTSNTTPIVVQFATAPPDLTNIEIQINGVSGTFAPWGRWFCTQVDDTHYSLNGSVADGTAGTGGTAYISSGMGFSPVYAATVWEPDNYQMGTSLGTYFWQDGVFKFVGATAPSQIHVTYWASGTAPASLATPLMDDCGSYAAVRLAGLFARSKGWVDIAAEYKLQALGRNGVADGRDGLLRDFVLTQIRSLQRGNIQRRLFRPRGPIFPVTGVTGLIGGFSGGGGVTPGVGSEGVYNVPAGASAIMDLNQGEVQYIVLTQNTSLRVPLNNRPGPWFMVIDQNSTGGWAATLTGSAWSSAIDPTAWSGSGVPGSTRVVIPLVTLNNGTIILNGVISGPTAI